MLRTYHQRVNQRIDENKDPDRRRHISHTSPHAQHGTSMVIGLESRAELSLGKNDEGIQNLVELAEVENPAVESDTFGPEAAGLSHAGKSIDDGRTLISRDEAAGRLVVVNGASQSLASKNSAEAISGASQSTRSIRTEDGPPHSTKHTPESPSRVNSQEDVVKNDKGEEWPRLGDCPRLLSILLVVYVEALDGDGVQSGDGQGDLGIESSREPMVGNIERAHDGSRNMLRRNWRRSIGRRE